MLLAHGPDLQEDNGVFLSGVDFPLPQWTSLIGFLLVLLFLSGRGLLSTMPLRLIGQNWVTGPFLSRKGGWKRQYLVFPDTFLGGRL